MSGRGSVSVIVCMPPTKCATALMNANAFPAACTDRVDPAARRLAVFMHHVAMLPVEIAKSREEFLVHLTRNWDSYRATARSTPAVELVAFPDGIDYLASLHSIHYEFKAFLDLFARLICRLISDKDGGPVGFKSRDKDPFAGGRLFNWLAGQSTAMFPKRDELVTLLKRESIEWITAAVDVRDALGHYRDVPGLIHMRISLSDGPDRILASDILGPLMPDGRPLEVYASDLQSRLGALVTDVLNLLPNVVPGLNEPWSSAQHYLCD